MTAPARTRRRNSEARQRARAAEATTAVEDAPERTASPRRKPRAGGRTAAERAYARRAQRAELLQHEPEATPKPAAKKVTTAGTAKFRLSWPKSRASFVLLTMGLLAAGVAGTLWLSTQAIADSYRLEQIRSENARMVERTQNLQRDVTEAESASKLAEAARNLGMVPGGDPARVVVSPDGTTAVVGEPKKARGAPVSAPAPQVPPAPGTQSEQGVPVEGDQPAVPADAGGQ